MAGKKKPGVVRETKHDEIGFWSELKLDILKRYWPEYTKIVKKQSLNFHTLYVDVFAGSGKHISRSTGEFVAGSPTRALAVEPPFDEYHFIDLDDAKVRALEVLAAERDDVHVYQGDCNEVLLRDIYPRAKYKNYRRAVCLLDPYSLQLDWKVIAEAGRMRSVEIFLNFPIMDINRAVLHPQASPAKIQQMNRFWGDDSWKQRHTGRSTLYSATSTPPKWRIGSSCTRSANASGSRADSTTFRNPLPCATRRVQPFITCSSRETTQPGTRSSTGSSRTIAIRGTADER